MVFYCIKLNWYHEFYQILTSGDCDSCCTIFGKKLELFQDGEGTVWKDEEKGHEQGNSEH